MSSADEPAAASEPTLREEVLAELRSVGGDRLVRELMAIFAERTPGRLRSAAESFAAGDLVAAAAALHSLRSAAGTVGARRLAEMAGQLERAARSDGDLAPGLARLRVEAEQALLEARRLSQKPS